MGFHTRTRSSGSFISLQTRPGGSSGNEEDERLMIYKFDNDIDDTILIEFTNMLAGRMNNNHDCNNKHHRSKSLEEMISKFYNKVRGRRKEKRSEHAGNTTLRFEV